MADNYEVNAASGGKTFASDDIAGVDYPISKLAFGALGSATLAASGAGSVSAGTQRDTLATVDPAVVDLAAIEVLLTTLNGYVDGLETLIGTTNTKVDELLTDTELRASAVPVSLASLPTLAAGTNNIGDVDVLTVPADPFGANADAAVSAGAAGSIQAKLRRLTQGVEDLKTGIVLAAGTAAIGKLAANSGVDIGDVDVTSLPSLPAGSNAIGKLAANSGVDIGDVDVTSISAGTNLIGDVSLQGRTTNGLSIFRSIDLDETEEEVKGTAGQVYGVWFSNLATTTRFLKFYNDTAANVSVGTTTPVITLALPGNSSDDISGVFSTAIGLAFSAAITVAATTGVADNDTGAPSANDVLVNIFYK